MILRPIASGDAGPIFESYAKDPVVTRFLTWRPHDSLADTKAYIAHCLGTAPHVARTYVLTSNKGGETSSGQRSNTIHGALDLRLVAPHRLEFGYVLARTDWARA